MQGRDSVKRPATRLFLASGGLALVLGWACPADAQTIKVGSFTKAAGAGQTVPHGLGQTPKALILWTDGKTNESFSTDFLYAFGMTDGTTSFSTAASSLNGVATPSVWRELANKALAIWSPGGVALAEADLQSWDTTNFTLSWTTNNATAYVIHFVAIGGPAVSAKVVNWQMRTSPGVQSVATVGFTPDVVLHAYPGPGFLTAPPSGQAGAHFGLGVMDKNGGQWATDEESYNGPTAFTTRGQQTNVCIYAFNNTRVVQKAASFVSMDPTGFTVNFTTANVNASQVISLALKGVAAKAGSFLKSTTSSLPTYVQSQSRSVGGVATLSMSFPAASTSGNLVVVSFDFNNQSRTVTSVTDNLGNVYQRAIGPSDWGTGERSYTYYAPNITGGAVITLTITLSGPATSFIEAYAGEYRGVAAVSPLDQTSFGSGTGTVLSSGSRTTLSPVELIWGFCDVENGTATPTGPLIARETLNLNFAGDWTVSSAGSYAVTGTLSASFAWACHMATFRAGGQSVAGVGFEPAAVLLASVQDVTQALSPPALAVPHTRFGLGAADRTGGQGASAVADNDGSNPTSVQGIDKTSKAFVKVNNNTSTIDAEAVVASFDAGGFTLDWTTNDAVATQILYLALDAPQINYRSIGKRADYGTTQTDGNGSSVTATQGSTLVTGSGTVFWRTFNRGRGDVIEIDPGAVPYTIAALNSENQLTLTTPYTGISTGGKAYRIRRQFTKPSDWVACIDGPPGCTYFPTSSSSLVADDRSEVGILYNDDGPDGDSLSEPFLPPGPSQEIVKIAGMTTNANHTITLTADPGNRHSGVAWSGVGATPHVVFDNSNNNFMAVLVQDDFVTVEWIEVRGNGSGSAGLAVGYGPDSITPSNGSVSSTIVMRNNIVHNVDHGIRIGHDTLLPADSLIVKVYDNVLYNLSNSAVLVDETVQSTDPALISVMNNSAWNCANCYYAPGTSNGRVLFRNNIGAGSTGTDFWLNGGAVLSPLSSNNLTEDATATAASPGGNAQPNIPLTGAGGINFVSTTLGSENLHLQATSQAIDRGVNLSPAFFLDIDGAIRPGTWDIGADEYGVSTEVKLVSFTAAAGDGTVRLDWRTASELSNLGFHVYRGLSEGGPWIRLTSSLIPGLGSSAVGQAYSYRDAGLANGTRYYYRLEDVDTASKVTSHGPVSAVPLAGAPVGAPGSEPPASGPSAKKKGAVSPSCPDWVAAAYGSLAGASASSAALSCTRHGDPDAVSLGVISRDSRSATLELKTGGFYALHEASGKVRVFVPGFDFPQDPQAPALPFRRALVDAVVGRRVQLGGVRALDQVGFPGLVPTALGKVEMQVSRDGTVRAGRRALPESSPQHVSIDLARLLPSVFQGETKSAVVVLTPLRYDARRQQIVLSKRLLVRLLFTGRETGESGRGSYGRRERPQKPVAGELLARLYTTTRGLYAVSFDQLFSARGRGFAASQLRLERQGEAQGFHVEPASDTFRPGSVLYFYADTAASSTDFSSETAWELLQARDGVPMPLLSAAPTGDAVTTPSTGQASFKMNRFYQPGLLEAPELWLWESLASGTTRSDSFSLTGVNAASSQAAVLEVFLQGASESGNAIDHHVSVSVNGTLVGETQFAGKTAYRMSLSVPPSLLHEGANELSLTNVPDTGVSSYVFLDRFTVAYPQTSSLASGVFEGTWAESGTATVTGTAAALLDVTAAPSWLQGYETTGGSLRFGAETGHRYLAVSQQALLTPRVAAPAPSSLRSTQNQADYLLIAPSAFLAAAEPLLQRRQDQGLQTRAVAFEEIADEFGHGQPSAEAIKSFLAFAFQSWARPSPRYVLLLGDSSYDPRNFIGSSRPSPLPALWAKTSYLWTVSDPELAAVNGDDELPDLAIGRLPATTVAEAQSLVQKLLAWEDSGQGLSGAALLVADNPDLAGDFEADIDNVAQSYLQGREVRELKLSELGGGMRPAILDALNSGLSLLGYVGHGGAAVWASENVWNSWDAASLQAQSRQPLLITLDCLNGYFVAPSFDSLAESLLKAEGRGAIASVSPSGLSLDGPAHQYHRALMAEITGGQHARLGDALTAAQKAYAQTGLMPELLAVYHLLGDPAMVIR